MNHKELQAIRKLLMLDVSEAAEFIGKVSPRSWQYWESGRYAVPADVCVEMETLLNIRLEMMGELDDRLAAGEKGLRLPFCSAFEQFAETNPGATKVTWRLTQSVAALYFTEGHAELV